MPALEQIKSSEEVTVSRSLVEAYGIPEEFSKVAISPTLSKTSGYFRFGSEICYGKSATPVQPVISDSLSDAYCAIKFDQSSFVLPFHPDEIVDNLRLERYVTQCAARKQQVLYNAYYLVRPLLPVAIRKQLQKARLRKSRNVSFPKWPLDTSADQILERLLIAILEVHPSHSIPFIWFWPGDAPSCTIITHDVETSAGLEFCSRLMDIDDSFGIKSSFQLVPEKRYKVTDKILHSMEDRGFEVNVHDLNHDGRLYSDRREFLARATKINGYARQFRAAGFRSGAMYRNLNWYDAFEFSYDMSVPTVGHLEAQEGGCCTVRPYFVGDVVELPLTTTQDYSLFHILGDYSIDLWKVQIEKVLTNYGLASFIVHPDYVMTSAAQVVYKSLLQFLSDLRDKQKTWIALPGETAQWWRQRSQMKLKCTERGWNIENDSQRKAHIAYAELGRAGLNYRHNPPGAAFGR